ncbi:hypothetical protein KY382_11705 [Pseudomonas monteilii]|nr:hypothetical protein [Pseudomonas monteilii]
MQYSMFVSSYLAANSASAALQGSSDSDSLSPLSLPVKKVSNTSQKHLSFPPGTLAQYFASPAKEEKNQYQARGNISQNGSFMFKPGDEEKYAYTPSIYLMKLSDDRETARTQLKGLRDAYRANQSVPDFLKKESALSSGYDTRWMDAYVKAPTQVAHRSKNFFTQVDPTNKVNNLDDIISNPMEQKHKEGGVSFLSWFVHPRSFVDAETKKRTINDYSYATFRQVAAKHQQLKLSGEHVEPSSTPTAGAAQIKDARFAKNKAERLQIESGQLIGQKYLATPLDLTKEDLPKLKQLKADSQRFFEEKFGFDATKDKLNQYFHMPYARVTTTLHLHSRLNQEMAPREATKSFRLDDVIKHLESHDDIFDLIYERAQSVKGLEQQKPIDMVAELGGENSVKFEYVGGYFKDDNGHFKLKGRDPLRE